MRVKVAERQGNLDDDKPGPIEAFIVTDTGVGFTDTNYDSFQTVDSPYKAAHGGKGLGRFLWLKAFLRVEIESHVSHTFDFLKKIPWTKGLASVPEIAWGHHEKLNGSGYPRRVRGEQLKLRSRVALLQERQPLGGEDQITALPVGAFGAVA